MAALENLGVPAETRPLKGGLGDYAFVHRRRRKGKGGGAHDDDAADFADAAAAAAGFADAAAADAAAAAGRKTRRSKNYVDYFVPKLIERKGMEDLAASFKDGRWLSQVRAITRKQGRQISVVHDFLILLLLLLLCRCQQHTTCGSGACAVLG